MSGQRYHGARKAGLACVGAAIAWWWWSRRPFAVAIDGESMAPALQAGDLVIAVRVGRLRRGDLVLVEHPSRPGYEMVKRVAGGPGGSVGERTLAGTELWVLGDNAPRSTDSRAFGPMRLDAVRGVARFRYWPPSRFGPLRRGATDG